MKKSDLLGVFALLTGGLFALQGESAVVAAPLAAGAAYAVTRSDARAERRSLTARLAALGPRGR